MSARAWLAGSLPLLGTVLALMLPAGAAAGRPSLTFGSCSRTQVVVPASGLQCATLDVPFDRAELAVGDVALAVQRVPRALHE
jgi:hypothetical protein